MLPTSHFAGEGDGWLFFCTKTFLLVSAPNPNKNTAISPGKTSSLASSSPRTSHQPYERQKKSNREAQSSRQPILLGEGRGRLADREFVRKLHGVGQPSRGRRDAERDVEMHYVRIACTLQDREALAAHSAPEFRHSCPLAEIERKNEEHNEPVSALEKAQTSLFASAGLGAGFHVTELDTWPVG